MLGGIACYGNMVGERPWLNDVIGVLMVLANSLTAQLIVAVIVATRSSAQRASLTRSRLN